MIINNLQITNLRDLSHYLALKHRDTMYREMPMSRLVLNKIFFTFDMSGLGVFEYS